MHPSSILRPTMLHRAAAGQDNSNNSKNRDAETPLDKPIFMYGEKGQLKLKFAM
jgi:hypothetical protein